MVVVQHSSSGRYPDWEDDHLSVRHRSSSISAGSRSDWSANPVRNRFIITHDIVAVIIKDD